MKKYTAAPPETLTDSFSKRLWSYDASLFEVRPKKIVFPRSVEEVQFSIQQALVDGISVTARGGGTGTTGAALGKGMILDLSKSMRSIISYDEASQTILCETGATLDDINLFLDKHNRMIGADLSTADRATIGGMIASNSAGAHSRTFGSMREQIESIEVVLADGSLHSFGFIHQKDQDSTPITKALFSLRNTFHDLILKETAKIARGAFHIPLDELCYPDGINIGKLFAGSQGTLGIVTKARLKTVPKISVESAYLLSFSSIMDAIRATKSLIGLHMYSIELIDRYILDASHSSEALKICNNSAQAFVLLESIGKKIDTFSLPGLLSSIFLDQEKYQEVLKIRREGLSNLRARTTKTSRSQQKPCGFIEDLVCPIESMEPFYSAIFQLLEKENFSFAVYGHMGAGCLHIRPFIEIEDPTVQQKLIPLMKDVMHIVQRFHGIFSSEHGSGTIRSWLTPYAYTKEYVDLLESVKAIFDPKKILNPGKLFQPYDNFLTLLPPPSSTDFSHASTPFFFKSHQNGGLQKSAASCTSNGKCRKGSGLMCPPFQITRDERDSTRGRAHAFLEMDLNYSQKSHEDRLKKENEASFDYILDHCIQCKGCISECPSHINIGKMKSERLWEKKERDLRHRLRSWLMAYTPTYLFRCPNWFRTLTSKIFSFSLVQKMATNLLDSTEDAVQPFVNLRASHYPTSMTPKDASVILIIDSFHDLFHPKIVESTITLLEKIGHKVYPLPLISCGRALISKGFLDRAKKEIQKTITSFESLPASIPLLFIEPSVWSAIHDEWADMPDIDQTAVTSIATRAFLLEDFLLTQIDVLRELYKNNPHEERDLFFHEHCHARALAHARPITHDSSWNMKQLLEIVPGTHFFYDKEASCCGMAGSFGLEKEHEQLSKKIGEKSLQYAKKHDIIITTGVSCTMQAIRLFPNKQILHPTEFLLQSIQNNSSSTT